MTTKQKMKKLLALPDPFPDTPMLRAAREASCRQRTTTKEQQRVVRKWFNERAAKKMAVAGH